MFTPIAEVKDWKDLQDKVCSFFSELGYDAATDVPVMLSNNASANVDVVATMGSSPLAQKILFECKYWNSEVPRAIVQSFKMDVQEAGANFGIIVTKKGFQEGAYKGVSLTTVKLYTFEELQIQFAKEWSKQNLFPIKLLFKDLQVELQDFDRFTPGGATFLRSLFTDALRKRADKVRARMELPVALFKDFYVEDGLSPVYSYSIEHFCDKGRVIAFHDARTLAHWLGVLFNEAFAEWIDLREAIGNALAESPQKLAEIFGLNSPTIPGLAPPGDGTTPS